MDNKLIGKYLAEKRKSKDMTQSDLAELLNVTYQAVSRWETGESIPDIGTLDQIATLYNVSIDEILQRKTAPKNNENNMEFPEPIQAIFFMIGVFLHGIGFAQYWMFIQFDLRVIGLLGYFIIFLVVLFIQNLGFFVNDSKRKKDVILYFLTYVPLVISIFIMAIYK